MATNIHRNDVVEVITGSDRGKKGRVLRVDAEKHRVLVAGNGREALLALEKTAFQGFDLILMDLQMPEMDGLRATAAIRE